MATTNTIIIVLISFSNDAIEVVFHKKRKIMLNRLFKKWRAWQQQVLAWKCVLGGTRLGDPELLTLKAYRIIQTADLLLYDRLMSNDVLKLVDSGARLLYVGKTARYHSRTQEVIHELLLSVAEVGANVVRLKGRDPLVFGSGGEEMDFLRQQGIEVNVIPSTMID
ncbi:PREDICTED: uroporphyrinogen-III C-methyltransferase-like [Prunus mume]|uniref:Uroporphyrinogen-III C-methyltransferase-like n=1 Tax=Prunus mume TaxID=102107 RepID=A0ABM1LI27_PRUMU|nr:PREDICTED: uroporphyrinogen-III C-methyltransferase-like [Prunus mume]